MDNPAFPLLCEDFWWILGPTTGTRSCLLDGISAFSLLPRSRRFDILICNVASKYQTSYLNGPNNAQVLWPPRVLRTIMSSPSIKRRRSSSIMPKQEFLADNWRVDRKRRRLSTRFPRRLRLAPIVRAGLVCSPVGFLGRCGLLFHVNASCPELLVTILSRCDLQCQMT